ncbi:MAG TPA: hypothetical protein VNO21_06215 [Polyangiaceae bacterium]|nr:hypothetical protein [Polyangiaceae bacterium]
MNDQDVLLTCEGGTVTLPPTPLNDRQDGGHLLVNPPREVWERSELTPVELANWSLLIAATGQAMLEVLPQLRGGCLNYWEAGNWALNDQAIPVGPKSPRDHRKVHLHIFGRSRTALHRDWQWGESPFFPTFVDSKRWASQFARFDPDECTAIRERIGALLALKYVLSRQS